MLLCLRLLFSLAVSQPAAVYLLSAVNTLGSCMCVFSNEIVLFYLSEINISSNKSCVLTCIYCLKEVVSPFLTHSTFQHTAHPDEQITQCGTYIKHTLYIRQPPTLLLFRSPIALLLPVRMPGWWP